MNSRVGISAKGSPTQRAACTRPPAKCAGATLAPGASAGVVVGVGARPSGSQAVSAAWSWFRQSGVISSRPLASSADRWALRNQTYLTVLRLR